MEAAAAFGRSRPVVKTEKVAGDGDVVVGRDSPSKQHLLVKMGNYGKQEHETEVKKISSSDQKDLSCTTLQEEELESARAEMGEVREENERLKMSLDRMMKDYEALRMQFLGIVGSQEGNNKVPAIDHHRNKDQIDETELVSLTLGRSLFPAAEKKKKPAGVGDEQAVKETLSLGLNSKFDDDQSKELANNDSPNQSLAGTNNSSDDHEAKEEAGETTWPPSKGTKTMRSTGDDEAAPHSNNPPKRARVCVRARCETTTMNDGCQWRKYGQKIAKGNPCPRAYYRCTGSPTCPVRKQVQRCADDMSILITTYEGNHNHQLPVSATAMASTTSAAASMLLSGSSSSTTSTSAALNLYLSPNNSNSSSKPNFYLPNNSSISSTTSPTHPTITLDLTSSNNNSTSHFGKFSSPPNFAISRYPFTSQLDFGSSRHNILSWNNGLLSYNTPNNNHHHHPTTTTTTNNIYQNYIQQQQQQRNYNNNNNNNNNNVAATATSLPPQHALPDTIAAATKAITADPSFQSALAAALTSIIGSGSSSGAALVKSSNPLSSTAKGNNGCGSSFLSNLAAAPQSSSPPAGNMVFVPANSLPFSTPKSASASPGDHIDLTN